MRSPQFFRSREFLDLEKNPSPPVADTGAGILRRTRTRDLRHYRRSDNAPRLRRFLERGPGRADEMGGDRSPAPCGGTWGCAAPRGELGATRNCSGARRRRASSPHVAGICCVSVHLRCEVFGRSASARPGKDRRLDPRAHSAGSPRERISRSMCSCSRPSVPIRSKILPWQAGSDGAHQASSLPGADIPLRIACRSPGRVASLALPYVS
jgi:hypothetical protein